MTHTVSRVGPPAVIFADEIAARLGCHRDTFLAKRAALEAMGFPAPMSCFARPLRWHRAAVLAWIETGETAPASPASHTDAPEQQDAAGCSNVITLERRLAARSAAGL